MKLFSLFFCVLLSAHMSSQQSNRNQQTQSLSYSAGDVNLFPPISVSTTTTTTPESTTKKKGFFSGLTGIFKSKDKESTTINPVTTTTTKKSKEKQTSTTTTTTVSTTTTSKSQTISQTTQKEPIKADLTTPKLPARNESPTPPTRPPSPTSQQQTTTSSPNKKTTKDDFPSLPTVKQNNQFPTLPPAVPNNAWGKNPSTATTLSPQQPNAWGKPLSGTHSTQNPQRYSPTTTTTRKPNFQSPSGGVSGSVGGNEKSLVSDAELLTLSNELFSKDINNPFKYVTVNYQGRTQSSSNLDEASQPLLKVDDKVYKLSTVEKMTLLFNNYERDTMVNEYVSPVERKEEDEFLDVILATPVMKHAMNFLQQKSVVTPDPQTHREFLRTIWFGLYSRGMGKIGSSGFEHVFVSEIKNGTVLGLHNWIYMNEEEKKGDLNYKGWLKKIDLGNKGQIAKVRFALNNVEKPSNSLFIGTSPELELAVYSICFGLRADKDCRLAYAGKDFNIVTHSWKYRGKNLIGSAYPEI